MTLYMENEVEAKFDFDTEDVCKQCIEAVLTNLRCPYECEVSVTITDKEKIHQINREFRDVDRPTDVLSFPMMEYDVPGDFTSQTFMDTLSVSPDTDEMILGDIILCEDIIRNQAKEYEHTELREFAFLVVHSLLHLCGFDHMKEDERIEMEEKQKEIMKELNILR